MAAPTKQASALSPTKQVSLVEDHGEQGIRPFRAVDDNGAAAALAVKREASNQKLEADRDAREMRKWHGTLGDASIPLGTPMHVRMSASVDAGSLGNLGVGQAPQKLILFILGPT